MYRVSYDGSNKKVMWQEMWRHEFEDALERDPVVIVPVGSVEQHGPHCPMDVDISAPFYMAVAVAQRVDDFPVIVAPPVWSGFTHYNMGFPGTINLRLETFQNLLADIFRSIYANGFKRIISVNGHGGNAAPCRAVSWQVAEENIFTLSFSWWDMVDKELREWSATNEGVGHAGEWETAVQLHLREHLVDKSRIDSDVTGTRPFSDESVVCGVCRAETRYEKGYGYYGRCVCCECGKGCAYF